VIAKISTDGCRVRGVTSVDDELFVLQKQDDSEVPDQHQVAVYSLDDYQLLRRLTVPEYMSDIYSDITSCKQHRCVYMSDYMFRCIHRYDVASSATSKLLVPSRPYGLSVVTASCNLLVACCDPNKLLEMRADTHACVREIALQSDIDCP